MNEANLKKVITATGVKADSARIKALVASLKGIDIDEAIKTSVPATPAATSQAEVKEEKAEKKEKKKEEKEKSEEEAASGLASLFG